MALPSGWHGDEGSHSFMSGPLEVAVWGFPDSDLYRWTVRRFSGVHALPDSEISTTAANARKQGLLATAKILGELAQKARKHAADLFVCEYCKKGADSEAEAGKELPAGWRLYFVGPCVQIHLCPACTHHLDDYLAEVEAQDQARAEALAPFSAAVDAADEAVWEATKHLNVAVNEANSALTAADNAFSVAHPEPKLPSWLAHLRES